MKDKGISLLEVIVSIFIVAFVLVGILRLYALGSIQLEIARHKEMAVNLAQSKIEELKDTGFEGIVLAGYPLTEAVIIDRGQTPAVGDDINGTRVTDISVINEGYKVIVTVSWTDYYGVINEVMESTITSYF